MSKGQVDSQILPLAKTIFFSKDDMGIKHIEKYSVDVSLFDTVCHDESIWLNGKCDISLDYYGVEGQKLYKTRVSVPVKEKMSKEWLQKDEKNIEAKVVDEEFQVVSPYVLEFNGKLQVADLLKTSKKIEKQKLSNGLLDDNKKENSDEIDKKKLKEKSISLQKSAKNSETKKETPSHNLQKLKDNALLKLEGINNKKNLSNGKTNETEYTEKYDEENNQSGKNNKNASENDLNSQNTNVGKVAENQADNKENEAKILLGEKLSVEDTEKIYDIVEEKAQGKFEETKEHPENNDLDFGKMADESNSEPIAEETTESDLLNREAMEDNNHYPNKEAEIVATEEEDTVISLTDLADKDKFIAPSGVVISIKPMLNDFERTKSLFGESSFCRKYKKIEDNGECKWCVKE